MKKEFLVNRQGKDFVLYAGLLDEAHAQGLKRITTTLVQIPGPDNGQVAIVHAEVETEKGVFSGIGDASPQNVGRMIALHTIRMAECVPLSATILTRDGWKKYDELVLGQEVLAHDPRVNKNRWVPLEAVNVFPGEYVGTRLTSRSFDVRCTTNHTWVVGKYLRQTQTLRAGDHVRVAAPSEGGDHPLTPREAAILGWVATDGTVRNTFTNGYGPYLRIRVVQSKSPQVADLRHLLDGLAHETVSESRDRDFGLYTSTCLPQHCFELRAEYARYFWSKVGIEDWLALPALITRLSQPARAALLDAMIAGDGAVNRGGRRIVFGKKRKPGVMEAFEILCTLEGWALGIPRIGSTSAIPLRTVRRHTTIASAYLQQTPITLDGVWCPTTPFGTWVANIDGTITITGNTRAKARALRDAINVGAAALEELGPEEEDAPAAPKRDVNQRTGEMPYTPAPSTPVSPPPPSATASKEIMDRLWDLYRQTQIYNIRIAEPPASLTRAAAIELGNKLKAKIEEAEAAARGVRYERSMDR